MNEDVSDQDSELLDPEIVGAFLDESDEALEAVDSHLIALEANPDEHEGLHSVFRAFHSIKGNSAFFGFMKVKLLAHRLEDVLALMRDGKLAATKPVMNGLLAGVDQLKAMLARIREQESECAADAEAKLAELTETLTSLCVPDEQQTADLWPGVLKQFDELISVLANDADLGEAITRLHGDLLRLAPAKHTAPTEAVELNPAEAAKEKLPADRQSSVADQAATGSSQPAAPTQKQAAGDAAHRTMRVEEKKIDEFLDYVGELIMVREMFANVGKTLRAENTLTHVSAEYQRALEAFTSLSLDL